MRASTGYKALLRFLYLREESTQESNGEVDRILWELREIDSCFGESYGFASFGDARSFNAQISLAFLDEMALVIYQPSNPHVELTELGRGFASQLEFPEELEQAIPAFLQSL